MAIRHLVRSMLSTAATKKSAIILKSNFSSAIAKTILPQIPIYCAPVSTATCISSFYPAYKFMEEEYGDCKHWNVFMKFPPTQEENHIHVFTKILAKIAGSEQEAKARIYSTVKASDGYFFRANLSNEEADDLRGMQHCVRRVCPDLFYGEERPQPPGPLTEAKWKELQAEYNIILEKEKNNLQVKRNTMHVSCIPYLHRQPGAALPGMVKIAAAPGIDEWRLFMECFIRLRRSYLSVKDFKYRFKVFKDKLEMKEDGCYEFDESFDLTREELLKSSIHKIIHRNHMLELESDRYVKDPWRLFMNFVIRKKLIYESCEDMMDRFKKFSTKFRQLERQNFKEHKDWASHSLIPPFDISEAEVEATQRQESRPS